jgi:hypothetical protein
VVCALANAKDSCDNIWIKESFLLENMEVRIHAAGDSSPSWVSWFLSFLCFAVAYFPLRNAVGVLSTSTKSEGTILEILQKENARGRFERHYKVAYSVNGVKKTTVIRVSKRPDLKVGSPITLYYSKADPNICVRGGFHLFGPIFVFGGFGLIYLLAGFPYFRSLSLNISPESFLIAISGSFVLLFFYFGIRELVGAEKVPNVGEGVGLIIGGVVFGLAAFLAYRNMRAHAEDVAESVSYLESHYSKPSYSAENISALAVSIIMMGINSNLPIDNNEYYHIIPFRLVGSNKKSGGTITQNLNLRTIAIYEKGTDELEGTVIIIPELNEYLENTRRVLLNRHKLMETNLPKGAFESKANTHDANQETPFGGPGSMLGRAIILGNEPAARLLIKHGADVKGTYERHSHCF